MKKITYVIGNWAKIASAKQILEPLGYEVDTIKMETPEIQADDVNCEPGNEPIVFERITKRRID